MPPPCIAIVNDAPQIVHLLEMILTRTGYRTISHHCAAGTLALLHRVRPALLILDIWMEVPDAGWQVLDAVRRDSTFAQLPVLIHSADPLIRASVDARADPYCMVLPLFSEVAVLPQLTARLIATTQRT